MKSTGSDRDWLSRASLMETTWESLSSWTMSSILGRWIWILFCRETRAGWERFKRLAKKQSKLLIQVKKTILEQVGRSNKFKYGYQIPNTYVEALLLDKQNGNSKWQEAVTLELSSIDEYQTFKDNGRAIFKGKEILNAPQGYKKIRVHLVFDVKHDGRHKARLVADGHLTQLPVESVYSSVVSLRSLRIFSFLN